MLVKLQKLVEMRKTLLIISAILFMNSSTELHQLFRIPLLLEHFHQHLKQDPSLSVLAFLKIHYTVANAHPVDNDEREDNQLPFKSADNINHIDSPVTLKGYFPEKTFIRVEDELPGYLPGYIPDKRIDLIFHPPRFS